MFGKWAGDARLLCHPSHIGDLTPLHFQAFPFTFIFTILRTHFKEMWEDLGTIEPKCPHLIQTPHTQLLPLSAPSLSRLTCFELRCSSFPLLDQNTNTPAHHVFFVCYLSAVTWHNDSMCNLTHVLPYYYLLLSWVAHLTLLWFARRQCSVSRKSHAAIFKSVSVAFIVIRYNVCFLGGCGESTSCHVVPDFPQKRISLIVDLNTFGSYDSQS